MLEKYWRAEVDQFEGHTEGPWRYRPCKLDDWGVVRSTDGTLIAQARSAAWLDDKVLDAHRQARTDPAEANARLIAAAPTLLRERDALVAATKWRPIETAPKDRLIDLCKGGTEYRYINCYYDDICDEWRTSRPSGHLFCIPRGVVTHWCEPPVLPALAAVAGREAG